MQCQCQKRFCVFWLFFLWIRSSITCYIQILNFGEDEIVSIFYACGLHVLSIVSILIIHSWPLILCIQSVIKCHDSIFNFQFSNFEEDEIISMFYACGLHVLCIVPMLIIHPHSGKHDIGGGNHGCVRLNVHLTESFLGGNKIIFYSSNH
jgi:hypothetical protein